MTPLNAMIVATYLVSLALHGHSAYVSAALETTWLAAPRRGAICRHTKSIERDARQWLSYSMSSGVWTPNQQPPLRPTDMQQRALSRFGSDQYIEPLHGMGRHPQAIVGCGKVEKPWYKKLISCFGKSCISSNYDIFNLTYLILQNDCAARTLGQPKPRVLLFDLGATNGLQGGIPKRVMQGGSAAPSIPLFYRLYLDRCLEPDDIFAWEVNAVPGTTFFGDVGPEIRGKTRFYNMPADTSMLSLLASQAKSEDFVVFKIDIDTPDVEHRIVNEIIANKTLAGLIDELFFEYHYYFDGLDFGWGENTRGDVDSAVRLMHNLRLLGIRSHFWI